jgi:hypothetical protein
MGNNNSMNNESDNKNKTVICLLCWEYIQTPHLLSCSKCNIQMHDSCYINYNKLKNHIHNACPNCKKICASDKELFIRECIFQRKGNAYYGRHVKINSDCV